MFRQSAQQANLVHLIGYTLACLNMIIYHTRRQAPKYHARFSVSKACLYAHIATGLFENFRYRVLFALRTGDDILPGQLDVMSCLVWSVSSFVLVRTLRHGDPRTTRPPYQPAALLRPVIYVVSYYWGLPSLHWVSMRALDSFVYARLLIFVFAHTPYLRGLPYSTAYAISIPLASTISVHESRVPGASLTFMLAVALVTKLNKWVTHIIRWRTILCRYIASRRIC